MKDPLDWLKLLARGIVHFRLTPEQVLSLTPAQFHACEEAYQDDLKLLDREFGYTRAIIAEPHRDSAKRSAPYGPEDFMLFSDDEQGVPGEQTPEQMLNYVKNFLVPHFNARAEVEAAEEERRNR